MSNPALLRQNLPPAWRTLPSVAGAAAVFLSANLSLCRGADSKPGATGLPLVAPIFEHGKGRGSTGCIVVTPPVFMSEEEAWQVIQEELVWSGISLADKQHLIQGVNEPLAQQVEDKNGNFSLQPRDSKPELTLYEPPPKKKLPYQADAADPKKHIALEFVSAKDFQNWCGHSWVTPDGGFCFSTVSTYRIKDQAVFVADRVKAEGLEKVFFGALYDPVGTSQTQSRRLLREQVRDFVKWLQAQGAI